MTAEIAILNRTAIALAADSAVTIRKVNGHKIYNSADKLFMLSKHHPVGIMIFSKAEFMDVPWETIIKVFREQLGSKKKPLLENYAAEFLKFLSSDTELFPLESRDGATIKIMWWKFNEIDQSIRKKVKETLDQGKLLSRKDVGKIVSDTIAHHHEIWKDGSPLQHAKKSYTPNFIKANLKIITSIRKRIFKNLPFSRSAVSMLKEIAAWLTCKDAFREITSGIVIAGFGEKEIFPGLIEYEIDEAYGDFLKYRVKRTVSIDYSQTAVLAPFAQREMVDTFMQGVDPDLKVIFLEKMEEILSQEQPEELSKIFGKTSKQRKQIKTRIENIGKGIFDKFEKYIADQILERHTSQVTEAISVLPKDELAAMAETLVNLTSFKRKVSLQSETVGGPIDVAVISKGDGFVWIKRKHYFNKELNHQFFVNYFK